MKNVPGLKSVFIIFIGVITLLVISFNLYKNYKEEKSNELSRKKTLEMAEEIHYEFHSMNCKCLDIYRK
jgi:hypothetical protein